MRIRYFVCDMKKPATPPPSIEVPDMMEATIRVLLAKVGLDGHDRGVKVVARGLRDAGMDVVYTGLHRTPEEVVDVLAEGEVEVTLRRFASDSGVSVLASLRPAIDY